MAYSNVFLFDLYDSLVNGKSCEKRVGKLVAEARLFHQVLYGYENTAHEINEAVRVFSPEGAVMNTAPFFSRA